MTFDHAGPMASTVEDLALLLEAIAGRDGVDSRQAMAGSPSSTPKYFQNLKARVGGLNIGVVSEGFGWKEAETDVEAGVRRAVSRFEELGASVKDISIPIHRKTAMLMVGVDSEGSWRALRNKGIDFGTFGYFNTELAGFLGEHMKMNDENFAPNAKLIAIFGEYLIKNTTPCSMQSLKTSAPP